MIFKRLLLAAFWGICLMAYPSFAQQITPIPLLFSRFEGTFRLQPGNGFHTNVKGEEADFLRSALYPHADKWTNKKRKGKNTVSLLLQPPQKEYVNPEAYRLVVNADGVCITASSGAGLFYGIQSLLQVGHFEGNDYVVPFLEVADVPRFGYRGIMLDVSRHFFTKEHLKKQIDALAQYKLNRLHLHLTDGAGWRIEIKKYPRLTEFAAWRKGTTWREWTSSGRLYLEEGAPDASGGYYTQEDIRELVDYARRRHITIIPEIEMPAHTEEVLAAYPNLSCSGLPYKNTDFCIGNEETFTFLQDVLSEIIDLFPSEYIHVGGDEAGKRGWKACPKCQRRMQEEGLKSVDELQSYLIKRMEVFLHSKGRRLLGWDEILEGGLAPRATVMSWRGEEGGIAAATTGHQAIMSPVTHCYLDYYQDAPLTQPEAFGGYLPLAKVYEYDPISQVLTQEQSKFILGVQANLWAEFVPTPQHAEYMLYPRALALAEVAWSFPFRKSWSNFRERAKVECLRLKQQGYNTFDLDSEVGQRKEFLSLISHQALGKEIVYHTPYNAAYAAGGACALVDGKRGSWNFKDGVWQGFNTGNRLDVTIDLGTSMPITEIYADFLQQANPDIYLPARLHIAISEDGEHFTTLTQQDYQVESKKSVDLRRFGWNGSARGRYVRFAADTDKKLDGWIFTDEIIVN